MLLGITFGITGCGKFWDDWTPTEEEREMLKSSNVSFQYFTARGFNLKFIGILGTVEDIMNDGTTYEFINDISLNVDDIFIVNDNDVITIANGKHERQASGRYMSYNPTFVNCNRNTMRIYCDERTVLERGTHIYSGTMYFLTGVKDHLFEFEIRDGLLIASLPAQYLMGAGNATMPLSASEVQHIINTGKEGVDYELFTRNGMTYVRIKNNLYERRYNSWVYSGIADPFLMVSWLRKQTSIIFEILDWGEITDPYHVFAEDGRTRVEDRNNVVLNGDNYYYAGNKRIGGNVSDPNDITTSLMGCSK